MGAVVSLDEAARVVNELKRQGKRVVFTNGVFDILHLGHVTYLEEARRLGDVLVVGVNSDGSARALKGPRRPILPQEERARLVAALECVDYVVIFSELTAEKVLKRLKPDLYVKGGDYTVQTLPEAPVVQGYGGRVVILPYVKGHSTTDIIRRIVARFCP